MAIPLHPYTTPASNLGFTLARACLSGSLLQEWQRLSSSYLEDFLPFHCNPNNRSGLTAWSSTECAKSAQCASVKHHYDECAERVTRQLEKADHKGPKEDCVEECEFLVSIYALYMHTALTLSSTDETLLPSSLPSATLRHSMRCTQALPPVKVRIGGCSQGRQQGVNVWWQRPRYFWSIQSRWANLYSYTSDLGIFSVRRVPAASGSIYRL